MLRFLYPTSRSQTRTGAVPRIDLFGACYGRGDKHDPERRMGAVRRAGRRNLSPSNPYVENPAARPPRITLHIKYPCARANS